MQIQKLQKEDLDNLLELAPEGWGDISLVFKRHFNQSFFFPIKLILKNKIVGLGELIINREVGWLGNIIVHKDFRNQGLGKKITEVLIEIAKEKDCESFYLIATPLGKYVYKKLGFQESGEYLFFKTDLGKLEKKVTKNIFPFQKKYQNQIFDLDKKAMGEDRSKVLIPYLQNSFIYKKEGTEKISGFFMPDLGDGLTICNEKTAALDFIKKRENLGLQKIILPEENTAIINFIKERGYTELRKPGTFMFIGKKRTWNPEMVICRIGGYIG